jgi:hypothetical protein
MTFTVTGDGIPRLHQYDVSNAEPSGFDGLHGATIASILEEFGGHVLLGFAKAVSLGLATPLGHGLGKIREQDREPEP